MARPSPFTIVTSTLAVTSTAALVFRRDDLGIFRYLLPVILGGVTYFVSSRLRKGTDAVITRHHYALVGSSVTSGATVGTLLDAVARHGYELDALRLDDEGSVTGAMPRDASLLGAQARLVDRRAREELGALSIRIRADAAGVLVGFFEADDTGPGIYDELAQFAIVELAAVVTGLEFTRMAPGATRRPAADLAEELPEHPYGLGLLGG